MVKIEELIKELEEISEAVSFYNASEDLNKIGDELDSKLILIIAKLKFSRDN